MGRKSVATRQIRATQFDQCSSAHRSRECCKSLHLWPSRALQSGGKHLWSKSHKCRSTIRRHEKQFWAGTSGGHERTPHHNRPYLSIHVHYCDRHDFLHSRLSTDSSTRILVCVWYFPATVPMHYEICNMIYKAQTRQVSRSSHTVVRLVRSSRHFIRLFDCRRGLFLWRSFRDRYYSYRRLGTTVERVNDASKPS